MQDLLKAYDEQFTMDDCHTIAIEADTHIREDIKFINRNRGSGTRIWLELYLGDRGIKPDHINGYAHETNSHSGISHAISTGFADVGIGLFSAAYEKGLDFIPLFEEQS